MSFWPLPAYSKLSVLTDKHKDYILRAIQDPQTQIEKQDRFTYLIYDESEALVVQSRNLFLILTLEIFRLFKSIPKHHP